MKANAFVLREIDTGRYRCQNLFINNDEYQKNIVNAQIYQKQEDAESIKCSLEKNLDQEFFKIVPVVLMEIEEKPQTESVDNNQPIEDLEFPIRTYNTLKRGGINLKEELLERSLNDLSGFRNMGRKDLKILIQTLAPYWDGTVFTLLDDQTKKNLPLKSLIVMLNQE